MSATAVSSCSGHVQPACHAVLCRLVWENGPFRRGDSWESNISHQDCQEWWHQVHTSSLCMLACFVACSHALLHALPCQRACQHQHCALMEGKDVTVCMFDASYCTLMLASITDHTLCLLHHVRAMQCLSQSSISRDLPLQHVSGRCTK